MTPLPDPAGGRVVVAAPGRGAGHWAGAASAAVDAEGTTWLADRVRRPLDDGRGVAVVVSRVVDGAEVEPVAEVHRDAFGAASLERPALVIRPDGGWRLYVSCATPGSKHWWVEALDADRPEGLPAGRRTRTLPGDAATGVKDPVVLVDADGWHLWLCCHPLTEPGHEDRMTTRHLTSDDGLAWRDHGEVLAGTPGTWDARGARVTAVLTRHPLTVLYGGRASAEENWFERTGVARATGDGHRLVADADGPLLSSPAGDGAFRYAVVLPRPDGGTQWFAEVAAADGAHDLRGWRMAPSRDEETP